MLTGGCQCGAVRYAIGAAPIRTYCCHCSECRVQSASAFGISVIVPAASLRVTRGQPKRWARDTASGGLLACWFCPDCGSRLWHVTEPAGPELSVKGGSLDDPPDLTGAAHIWTQSKLPGVCIPPGAPTYLQDQD